MKLDGSQKAIAAGTPNVAGAILILVYAATGYAGIGAVPDGATIQAAIGLIVLAGFGSWLTWWTPNGKTPVEPLSPAPQQPTEEA